MQASWQKYKYGDFITEQIEKSDILNLDVKRIAKTLNENIEEYDRTV